MMMGNMGHGSPRTLADDLIIEKDKKLLDELKQTEDRIKRHITECKREVIKELQSIFSESKLNKEFQDDPTQ